MTNISSCYPLCWAFPQFHMWLLKLKQAPLSINIGMSGLINPKKGSDRYPARCFKGGHHSGPQSRSGLHPSAPLRPTSSVNNLSGCWRNRRMPPNCSVSGKKRRASRSTRAKWTQVEVSVVISDGTIISRAEWSARVSSTRVGIHGGVVMFSC